MDPNVERALKKASSVNKLIIVAMGALTIASLKASQSMNELSEAWQRAETVEGPEEEDPAQQMEKIIEEYAERVN